MNYKPATVELSEEELRAAIRARVEAEGYEVISVIFSSYEVGHNGPTRCTARAEVRPKPSNAEVAAKEHEKAPPFWTGR